MPKAARAGSKIARLLSIAGTINREVHISEVLRYEDNRVDGSDADALFDESMRFMNEYPQGLNALTADTSPYHSFETVKLDNVVAYQDYIDVMYLQQLMERGYTGRATGPLYIMFRGKYYIEDGNHRTALAVLQGRKTIRANVVDFDTWLKDKRG